MIDKTSPPHGESVDNLFGMFTYYECSRKREQ
jgi:hypothetical protein